MTNYFYHIVTEKPLELGKMLLFDKNHHNSFYKQIIKTKKLLRLSNKPLDEVDQLIYNNINYWSIIADREIILEKTRKKKFKNYPSRMASLFVYKNEETARIWANTFIENDIHVYQIVKVNVNGNYFDGDAWNCWCNKISKKEALIKAENYWNNNPNEKNQPPLIETIVDGIIEVVEIIETFSDN